MTGSYADDLRPSQRMKAFGVVQEGDPILSQIAEKFDLPSEAEAIQMKKEANGSIKFACLVHDYKYITRH